MSPRELGEHAAGEGEIMITPFECWNGGRVQWDGAGLPQFAFAFPPESRDTVAFLQLSARICEVLTQSDWLLNVGGQLFDVPDLPVSEIHRLARAIRDAAGYVPVTVPYRLDSPTTGTITLRLVLWANVQTGRADVYLPLTGLVEGQQLLDPQPWPASDASPGAPAGATAEVPFQGRDAQGLLESLAALAGDSGETHDFLTTGGLGTGYPDSGGDAYEPDPYDAQTRFEDDSAGWPGGAYDNPDSGYYEPDRYDDY
jgi:hypothetical protein